MLNVSFTLNEDKIRFVTAMNQDSYRSILSNLRTTVPSEISSALSIRHHRLETDVNSMCTDAGSRTSRRTQTSIIRRRRGIST